ncbi:MAG: polysaccharide deacetylase family protein [Bacteroidales bacterium]|nr:polysaccharide deacetylase family protein [Bacteroidales bacterium]
MAYFHISGWMKMMYPGLIWDMRNTHNTIYLTFDDGPTPDVTDEVIDIMNRYNAQGTFFCLGRNVERHPDIYERIIRKGHTTGNHTYSHLKGWKSKNEEYYKDIDLARNQIESSLFRPPYGQIRRSQIKYLKNKYKIVMWEVMSHDYEKRISKEFSLKAILRYTKEGSIVVFHDSVKAIDKLRYILPRFIEHFSEKGYNFEAIRDR